MSHPNIIDHTPKATDAQIDRIYAMCRDKGLDAAMLSLDMFATSLMELSFDMAADFIAGLRRAPGNGVYTPPMFTDENRKRLTELLEKHK